MAIIGSVLYTPSGRVAEKLLEEAESVFRLMKAEPQLSGSWPVTEFEVMDNVTRPVKVLQPAKYEAISTRHLLSLKLLSQLSWLF